MKLLGLDLVLKTYYAKFFLSIFVKYSSKNNFKKMVVYSLIELNSKFLIMDKDRGPLIANEDVILARLTIFLSL